MGIKDKLKNLVSNFKKVQEIKPEARKRAERVIEAAKRTKKHR